MDSNNLFEGIKILSPDEIENPSSLTDDDNNPSSTDENDVPIHKNEKDALTIELEKFGSLLDNSDEDVTHPTTNNTNTEDVKTTKIKAFAKELFDEGVIDEFNEEEFDGTIESLKSLVENVTEKKATKKVEDYKNSFSAEKKRFLEIEDAFDQPALAMRVAQDLEFYNQVTEENIEEDVEIQKALYSRYLVAKGFTTEEVEEEIEEADALNKLVDKAKKALPSLKSGAENYITQSREQLKTKREETINSLKEDFETLLASIDSKEKLIEGLPFTKQHKEKIKEAMQTTVYEDPNTKRKFNDVGFKQFKNPKEFEILIQYYNALGLFDVDKNGSFKPNIKNLKNYLTKSQTDLESALLSDNAGFKTGRSNSKEDKTTDDILNFLSGNS